MPSIGLSRFALRGPTLLRAATIAVLAWLVYFPALHGGWLWDDRTELTTNLALRSWRGLEVLWLHPPWPDYYPVKSTVQWLLWQIWGDQGAAYHWTNLALHILSALLFWRLLAKLGVRFAWAGALLFTVHPLAVESVAWISELKNTLSLPAFLLSLIAYLDIEADPARSLRHYLAALGWFLVAMLSKASVVALPVILVAFLLWKKGRILRQEALGLIPFFLVGLGLGVVTLWFQVHRAIGIGETPPPANALTTLSRALMALLFYIYKFLVPIGLMPIYPRWPLGPERIWDLITGATFLLLFAWSCLWLPSRPAPGEPLSPCRRNLLFGFAALLATLAPVLGFAPMSYLRVSSVADHFAYLALLPLIGLVMAGAGEVARRWPIPRNAGFALVFALAGLLAIQSHRYARIFRDEEVLWRFNVAKNPTSAIAADNLAITLASLGRLPEALVWFEKSAQLNPEFAQGQNDLGMALVQNGRPAEALAAFERAVRTKPNFALACDNLGLALARAGRFAEARDRLQQALTIQPDFADARTHLGVVLADQGLWADAIAQYRLALQSDPENASAYSNLGSALISAGRPAEAAIALGQALRLQPDFPEAHNNMGNALLALGQQQRALAEYETAVRLQPNYAEGQNNLGYALASAGRSAEAMAHYRLALHAKPDFAEAHNNLGNEYLRGGQTGQAIDEYREALRLQPQLVTAHNNLGVALQQAGRLPEAVAEYRHTLEARPSDARAELNLGTALAMLGLGRQAFEHYRRALALDPDLPEAHYRLGESLEQIGRFQEALMEYQTALKLNPGYKQAQARLSKIR